MIYKVSIALTPTTDLDTKQFSYNQDFACGKILKYNESADCVWLDFESNQNAGVIYNFLCTFYSNENTPTIKVFDDSMIILASADTAVHYYFHNKMLLSMQMNVLEQQKKK
jgi:hypothetical protein